MHKCFVNYVTIGSDNGSSPGRCQHNIWTHYDILSIRRRQGTYLNEILFEIQISSFKKIHFKISSGKWQAFCLDPNVITNHGFHGLLLHCPQSEYIGQNRAPIVLSISHFMKFYHTICRFPSISGYQLSWHWSIPSRIYYILRHIQFVFAACFMAIYGISSGKWVNFRYDWG